MVGREDSVVARNRDHIYNSSLSRETHLAAEESYTHSKPTPMLNFEAAKLIHSLARTIVDSQYRHVYGDLSPPQNKNILVSKNMLIYYCETKS